MYCTNIYLQFCNVFIYRVLELFIHFIVATNTSIPLKSIYFVLMFYFIDPLTVLSLVKSACSIVTNRARSKFIGTESAQRGGGA